MRPAAGVALALAVTLPALAQHGGGGHAGYASHGASAAHSAPAFHGSYAPSAPMHYPYSGGSYSGAAMTYPPVTYPSSMRLLAPGVRYPARAPIIRPTFYHPTHPITITKTHSFYITTYPVYPYAYAYPSYVYGYLPADLLDDSFSNYNSSEQPQPEPQPDYGYAYPEPMPQPDNGYPQPVPQPGYAYPQPVPQPGYAYPQPMPAYPEPQPTPAAPQMQYVPGSASTVILIYKDGRPPEQIQNYLATRSTLTVLDGGRRREIPISELDLPATMSANQQTGVDFQLPSLTR